MRDLALSLMEAGRLSDAGGTDYRPANVVPIRRTERTHATILFADVQGSTGLCGSLELDEWWSTIASLFELMCEGVYRFGGWVGAFTGDGVKAVFESPSGSTSHAERACDAALWLREAIAAFAQRTERERGIDVEVRIGINSGEVLTGTIGDNHTRFYTTGGYPVALAKRVEGAAKPGQVYVSEHTAALLGRRLKLRDLGAVSVKGGRCPVGLFELVGAR